MTAPVAAGPDDFETRFGRNVKPEIVEDIAVSPVFQEPFWFEEKTYGIKIHVPSNWRNHVKMVDMRLPGGDFLQNAYGFVLHSNEVKIEAEQYVGVVVIYDKAVWHDFVQLPNESLLFEDETYVYIYVNSLFNQYPDLAQAALFDRLVIEHEQISKMISIEKIASDRN